MLPDSITFYKAYAVSKEDFMLHVRLLNYVVRKQDKKTFGEYKQQFSRLIGPGYFYGVLSVSMNQTAESDPEGYQWFLQNCA
jgi:hypothetical protein